MSKNSVNVVPFLVKVDGAVSLEASLAKFKGACQEYITGQLAAQDLIGAAVSQVFDKHLGATLNLAFIQSETIGILRAENPEQFASAAAFTTLMDRVQEYMQDNTNHPAREATAKRAAKPAVTGKAYTTKLGPNGGTYRDCDQKPQTATPAAE